ncbi:hypothetical protein NKH18_42400 [Streptomyces sp. M10(2022)]
MVGLDSGLELTELAQLFTPHGLLGHWTETHNQGKSCRSQRVPQGHTLPRGPGGPRFVTIAHRGPWA